MELTLRSFRYDAGVVRRRLSEFMKTTKLLLQPNFAVKLRTNGALSLELLDKLIQRVLRDVCFCPHSVGNA